jgi:dihydrofolate synthase/folylpolyglutamate synthase
VVEVGLGGRLDATNVLTPLISAITSISYDHTDLLGETLTEIAGEKAGIIKDNVPVVSASQAPSALEKIEAIAQAHNAPLTVVGRDWFFQPGLPNPDDQGQNGRQTILVMPPANASLLQSPAEFELALSGSHQQENAAVALAILDAIQEHFPKLSVDNLQQGLTAVSWPGRLQMLPTLPGSPSLLVDCAHNVDSAQKLALALRSDYRYQRLWLILGATADKDVAGIVNTLLPLADGAFMTTSGHPRAAKPQELAALATQGGFKAQTAPTVAEAVLAAWQNASPGDLICVTGSIFVVGDLLNQWDGLQSQLRS